MEKHDLRHEFPEFEEKIHNLKISDNHFKKLFDQYEEVNHKIHGLETTEVYSDMELNQLRSERLHLKDQLYEVLTSKN